eukprot:TRINITY_DN3114_c0_g1_i2.p1 TRINITY_DN3114_c0_g1~~TRINITY_DN3114_c0_g1_i2.p1  ORF type:complete len:724 (+),score=189.09 TRINITY_DN3114_c0_g1_i2:36-2207(+)
MFTHGAVGCVLFAAAAAQLPHNIPLTEDVVKGMLDGYRRTVGYPVDEDNSTLTDAQWGAVDQCLLKQTPPMASMSTFNPLELYIGPNSAGPANSSGPAYAVQLVSVFTAFDTFATDGTVRANMGSYTACQGEGGKYCYMAVASVGLASVCVPQSCSSDEATLMMSTVLPPIAPSSNISTGTAGGLTFHCSDDEQPDLSEDAGAQGTAAALSVLLAIAVVCTVCWQGWMFYLNLQAEREAKERTVLLQRSLLEGEAEKKAVEKPKGGFLSFAQGWDIKTSLDTLFSLQPKKRPTDFLNGMRFFSILWVILGHVVVYAQFDAPGIDNQDQVTRYEQSYRLVLGSSAYLAVDTFFFMSGFLACYLFLGAKAKRAWPEQFSAAVTAKNLGFTWLSRYIRLTPLYAAVLFGSTYLTEYIVSGPFRAMYHHGGMNAGACPKYWYLNLLYIQNMFQDPEKMFGCMGHGWYLANDFQFLIIGSFLMVGYIYKPNVSVVLTVLAMCVTWAFDIAFMTSRDSIDTMGMSNYMRPYIRGAPYMYGLLAAYVFAVHRERVERMTSTFWRRLAIYFVATLLMYGTVTVTWAASAKNKPTPTWTLAQARAYQFMYHFAWGLGLSLLACTWGCGHGGWISGFLSLRIFEPLGRMTFGVYLVHPLILGVATTASTGGGAANHFSDVWLLTNWIAVAFASHIASGITFVFIERPTGATYAWLLKRGWRTPKEPKLVEEEY